MGKVALVTGASAGLGEKFAHLFAADGHDVVLVARSAERLEALATALRAKNVKAHVFAADLSQPGAAKALFDRVQAAGHEIEFLVNNAGFGSNGAFLDLPLAKEVEMVQLNCTALLELCHLFAGPMRARKSGRILNIASTAAFQPGPFMSTYYATKAFVASFSEGLAHELQGTGVTVTCHCPGATRTEFAARSGNDKSRLFQRSSGIATADEVALHAYRAMHAGAVLSIHGFMNWVGVQAVRFSPRSAATAIAASLNKPPS